MANVNPFRRVFVRGPRLLLSLTLGLFNLSLSASASQCTGDVTAAMAQRERGGRRESSGGAADDDDGGDDGGAARILKHFTVAYIKQ